MCSKTSQLSGLFCLSAWLPNMQSSKPPCLALPSCHHVQNDRKLQGLLLPMAAKAVVAKAVVAKAAVTGAVAVKAGAAVAAAVAANVPQVSVQQAPCQQVCKDVCSYSLERSCKTVPVTKQVGGVWWKQVG